jgi:hypothetical protein
MARGNHANHVVVASARELVGFMWAIAQQVPMTPSPMDEPCSHHCEGCSRAGEGTQLRCGVTLDGVTRPAGILVPRARQAPDGRQSGGTQPTAISRINRRIDWLRFFQCTQGKNHHEDPKKIAIEA